MNLRSPNQLSTTIEIVVPDVTDKGVPPTPGEPKNGFPRIHTVPHSDELPGQTGHLDAVAICHAA